MHEEEVTTNLGTDSAWIRRHFADSIYIWACGEKADDDDEEPQLSDRLIGWFILFMQGFAYAMLIVLARATSSSDTDSSIDVSEESGYLLPSVTGAMYLLVASTTHDLHAGFSLLVNGSRAGHRAFGIGLLIVYGTMICTAMMVLVSTSHDSASVVLNAVAVLFVADLDEKALKFLLRVPQKWRLFWAFQSIGISFVMALIAISYIGASSPLLQESSLILSFFPSWFVWAVNPAAVTFTSFILSSTLRGVCDFLSEARESEDEPTFRVVVSKVKVGILATVKRTKERFIGEPCFYAILGVWVAQGVRNWFDLTSSKGYGGAVTFVLKNPPSEGTSLAITEDKLLLIFSNGVLAAGLPAKALGVFRNRHEGAFSRHGARVSCRGNMPRETWGNWADSRVPSLLVGWGVGFWLESLLVVLGCSWHGGGCGWNDAPIFVTYIGYVIIPCFLFAGVLVVAESNFFGTRFGVLVKPAVDILTNSRSVVCWAMATVVRDLMLSWIGSCNLIRVFHAQYV